MSAAENSLFVPTRQIAPYVEISKEGDGIVLRNSDQRVNLDREATALMMQWLYKAGFRASDSEWPGIAP